MSLTLRTAGLALSGLAVASFGLTACSSGSSGSGQAPAGQPNPTTIKGETLKTETSKPSHIESSGSKTSGGGSGQANSGFDGPAFQKAMAAISVPATSGTAGSASTGAGSMSYNLTGNQQGIGRIDCFVKAQGGSDSQSDHDALSLSSPFLESCGSFSQYGDLKTQAAQYVRTNLPTIQGESMATTTVGAIELKVGRAGPGNYFVTILNGG